MLRSIGSKCSGETWENGDFKTISIIAVRWRYRVHLAMIKGSVLSCVLQRCSSGEERRSGADVMRAVLSGSPGEPGFWPSRGRRGGPAEGTEEQPPPFYAHRGRELVPWGVVPGPATLGVEPPPTFSLVAQEPRRYLMFQHRRDGELDPQWLTRGRMRSIN